MACFDDYSDADPRSKIMRVNGVSTFLLNVSKCITFRQTRFVIATLIAEVSLESLYSRLCFKIIKNLRHILILKRLASNFIMSQENPDY